MPPTPIDPIDDLIILNRSRVAALMPDHRAQLEIVTSTYRALAAGRVEMPPKIGIHTRPDAFCHAMPAHLRDDDIAAIKWVSGYPGNASKGLPYIQGVIVVNDPDTGTPLAILDAAEITAARTAAASAACVERFAPDDWRSVAILGCGEQGRYHATILGTLNPDLHIFAYDPDPDRAAAIWPSVTVCSDAQAAVSNADVVVTAGPIRTSTQPSLRPEWLREEALVLPLDFDLYVGPEVIASCTTYAVDDIDQFAYYRSQGYLRGWPDPPRSTGALMAQEQRVRGGTMILNIGSGALDAAFAARVLRVHRESTEPGDGVATGPSTGPGTRQEGAIHV